MGPRARPIAQEAVSAEEASLAENDRLKVSEAVLAATSEPVVIADAANRIVAVNPAFSAVTGYEAHEAIGRSRTFFEAKRDDAVGAQEIMKILAAAGKWEGEVWVRAKTGELFPHWLKIVPVGSGTRSIAHTVSIFSDIAKRHGRGAADSAESGRDPLTSLADRRAMRARVEQALAHAAYARRRMAVLYIEIDRFREINERFGHAVGDATLIEIARRLDTCVRGRDAVGRMGGDDFLAVLPHIADADEAARVAARAREAVAQPLAVKGRARKAVVTASVGIAIYPDDADSAGDLMQKAAAAAYHAKEHKHEAIKFFGAESAAPAARRLSPQEDLRRAIENGDLVLEFEPRVRLVDGAIAGAEALVRWQRAEQGLVPPARFIPLAEETGLIEPLGQWVLDTACTQVRRWREAGLSPLPVAVNLSVRQLADPGFLDDVRRALALHHIPSGILELEITESALMEQAGEARAILREIRAMGVRLTADDFGTGYASLHSLRGLPLDAIKIDRAFVSDIAGATGDAHVALAGAVIAMGRSLGKKVIAEGVETKAQMDFLRSRGCDEIQGFCFSPPVAADVFANMVRQDRRL